MQKLIYSTASFSLTVVSIISLSLAILLYLSDSKHMPIAQSVEKYQTKTYYEALRSGHDISLTNEDIQGQEMDIFLVTLDSDVALLIVNSKMIVVDLSKMAQYMNYVITRNRVCSVTWAFIFILELAKVTDLPLTRIKYLDDELKIGNFKYSNMNFLMILKLFCMSELASKKVVIPVGLQ